MLMLLLAVDGQRYAINSRLVVEVLPLMTLSKSLQAPPAVAGLLRYHDRILSVIDLCQLMRGTPCRSHLSTRIIVLSCPQGDRPPLLLGLLAEQVTQMVAIAETQTFVRSDFTEATAPYLGDIVMDEQGMIQCLRVESLVASISESFPALLQPHLHVSNSD
jgi:chemotaxis-related protein WspB